MAYAEFMRKIKRPMRPFADLPDKERIGWQQLADNSKLFEYYGCYFPMFKD